MPLSGNGSGCALLLRDYKSQGARGDPGSPSAQGPASLQPKSRCPTCSRSLPRPVLRAPPPEPEPKPEEDPWCQDRPLIREFRLARVQRLCRSRHRVPGRTGRGTGRGVPARDWGCADAGSVEGENLDTRFTGQKGRGPGCLSSWSGGLGRLGSGGYVGAGTPESLELGALGTLSP